MVKKSKIYKIWALKIKQTCVNTISINEIRHWEIGLCDIFPVISSLLHTHQSHLTLAWYEISRLFILLFFFFFSFLLKAHFLRHVYVSCIQNILVCIAMPNKVMERERRRWRSHGNHKQGAFCALYLFIYLYMCFAFFSLIIIWNKNEKCWAKKIILVVCAMNILWVSERVCVSFIC